MTDSARAWPPPRSSTPRWKATGEKQDEEEPAESEGEKAHSEAAVEEEGQREEESHPLPSG